MKPYHKIQSVFKRDPATNNKTFLFGEYSTPEFEYLAENKWVFTEKIDGTNIRVMVDPENNNVEFRGKTDRAQIPSKLVKHLQDTFPADKMLEQFPDGACLYGEGCGAKIQKGGGNYYADQRFVLFDVLVGRWWLRRESVNEIAYELGIPFAPVIGAGTLADMIDRCKAGFNSRWGEFTAEGIVARPEVDLLARSGARIITKAKHKDFT